MSNEFLLTLLVNAMLIGAAYATVRERIKTLFSRVEKVEERHDKHVEKLDELCKEVSALVGRFDLLLGLGKADAIAQRNAAAKS